MQKMIKTCLIALSLTSVVISLTACSTFRFPGVYKVRVQQGNFIEKKMVDQLKIGMTPRQVQYIMGTPLIKDTFNIERWDYLFMVQRGGEVLVDKRFTVFFDEGALTKWETDIELTDSDTPDSNAEKDDPVPDPIIQS